MLLKLLLSHWIHPFLSQSVSQSLEVNLSHVILLPHHSSCQLSTGTRQKKPTQWMSVHCSDSIHNQHATRSSQTSTKQLQQTHSTWQRHSNHNKIWSEYTLYVLVHWRTTRCHHWFTFGHPVPMSTVTRFRLNRLFRCWFERFALNISTSLSE